MPISIFPENPIFDNAISLCFSIVVISGLLYYYIREIKRPSDDYNLQPDM